jgi:hypothetical protein
METTETNTPTPLSRRFRLARLSWVGLTAGALGWWLGRLTGDSLGWSQFSLAGSLTQIAMAILVALAGVLTINFFLASRTPPGEEVGHRKDEARR